MPRYVPCKADNGRLGYRKCAPQLLDEILTLNTVDTCQTLVGHGRGKQQEDGQDVITRRTLTDTSRQVFFASCKELGISVPTWYRNLKNDHKDVGRGKAKLDDCEDCLHWDRSLEPMIKSYLVECKRNLEDKLPGYWKRWDAENNQKEVNKSVTVPFIEAMLRYIAEHVSSNEREDLSQKHRLILHECEAAVLHSFRSTWPRVDQAIGLVDIVKHNHWHFTCRDAARTAYRQEMYSPIAGQRNFLIDFSQSPTLPVGPRQAGTWWFAPARLSISCLGVYIWGESVPKEGIYFMYMSRVMDHTPWYVIAVLDDVVKRLGDATNVTKDVMWSDIGLHFRCYRLWCYWLSHIPWVRNIETKHNYFPGGHGKTKLDGQFGRRERYTQQAALKKVISTPEEVVGILNERAKKVHDTNPTAAMTEYILFSPPPRKELFQKTFDVERRFQLLWYVFYLFGALWT